METDRLRQFCTIFETGNLRKAAELLHITHGALSKSMKKLESDLGYKLFLPEGRGLVVTDQAKKLYRKALDTLKSVEALYSVSHTDTEALKIGSFEVFTTYFLHQLKSWLPEIELKLYELTPGKMEESVGKGLIDFGITYVPIPYEGVEFVEVGKLKMGVYKKTESFINQELGELPFVVPNFPLEGSPSGVKGLDSWPESAPDRKIKYRVDLMESALALCREAVSYTHLTLPTSPHV